MSALFVLKIGYTSYIVSPADAAKVMTILSAAKCVQSEYLDGRTHYVEGDGEALSFEPMRVEITSRVERDRLRAVERDAWEAAKARNAAEDGEAAA